MRSGGKLLPTLFLVAIRGGGHTPFSGAANVDNVITIGLSRMKGVEAAYGNALPGLNFVSLGSKSTLPTSLSSNISETETQTSKSDSIVVSVGGGASWGDFYTELQPSNITPVGGRGLTLGVGGLLTGVNRAKTTRHEHELASILMYFSVEFLLQPRERFRV